VILFQVRYQHEKPWKDPTCHLSLASRIESRAGKGSAEGGAGIQARAGRKRELEAASQLWGGSLNLERKGGWEVTKERYPKIGPGDGVRRRPWEVHAYPRKWSSLKKKKRRTGQEPLAAVSLLPLRENGVDRRPSCLSVIWLQTTKKRERRPVPGAVEGHRRSANRAGFSPVPGLTRL